MTFYLNQTTNLFTRGIGLLTTLTSAGVKARDTLALDVKFHDGQAPTGAWEWESLREDWLVAHAAWEVAHAAWVVAGTGTEPVEPEEVLDLSAASNLVFAVKASRATAAVVYALVDTWTRVGLGHYRAFLSLNTETLVAAIADLNALDAVGEFSWSDDGTSWESSNTLAVRIENDVYKGVEGTPLALPSPLDWLETQLEPYALAADLAPYALAADLPVPLTDSQIASAEGRRLIASLQAVWPANAGTCHCATIKATSGNLTVQTTTGYFRMIFADGSLGMQNGTGNPAFLLSSSFPALGGHRAIGVMSVASGGSVRSGDVTYFQCSSAQVTAMDVSALTALISLFCDDNQLTALDVSNNAALVTLYCADNHLATLDASSNAALVILGCSENQLTTLDLSIDAALVTLSCGNNLLTTLAVSENAMLAELYCNGNALTNVDALLVALDASGILAGMADFSGFNADGANASPSNGTENGYDGLAALAALDSGKGWFVSYNP